MKKTTFFFSVALRNLRRGGQRIFVALLCIIFGVMSLVSMTMLAKAMEQVALIDARVENGGDMKIFSAETPYLDQEKLTQVQELHNAGLIDTYTLVAQNYTVAYRFTGSGSLHFPGIARGIEPDSYPLVGEIQFRNPVTAGLPTLLQEIGDVVVTRDLAADHQLEPGDEIILADLENGTPVYGRVTGIIADLPNHQGGSIYYNLETAAALLGSPQPVNQVILNTAQQDALIQTFSDTGWTIYPAEQLAENNRQVEDIIQTALNGAGILGLLVGGIGIANTMQVLLSRRSKEIAVLKTLGYRQSDLFALFLFEAFVLGLFGSLVGIALGAVLHRWLLQLFENTSSFLFTANLPLPPLVMGLVVGVVTTLIFSTYAIIRSANVVPSALLRNERILPARIGWRRIILLVLGLLAPFLLVTSFVMGSVIKGIGMLLVALAGLVVLGGLMSAIVWLVTRLIPAARLGLIRMVRSSLKQRGFSLVFAMIALFIGVVALTLATIVVQNAGREMGERTIVLEGANLTIAASAAAEPEIQAALAAQDIQPLDIGYLASVHQVVVASGDQAGTVLTYNLVARQNPQDFIFTGEPWGTQPQGVYTYEFTNIPAGTPLEIILQDGRSVTVTTAGAYQADSNNPTLMRTNGILLHADFFKELVAPDSTTYLVRADENRLNETTEALGQALPNATVINHMTFFSRFTQAYQNLYILALAMAGLALLAGTLLIANAVSLGMMERRYEIGVLKAVGYTRAHILSALTFEYSFLALVATLLAMAAVRIYTMIAAMLNPYAAEFLKFTPSGIVLILLMGTALPLAAVLAITWKPAQVSPSVLLQERI